MQTNWHQLTPDEVFSQLKTTRLGLSSEEVKSRQQQYGRNTLPEPKRKTLLQLFISQFLSPLIYILIGAAIISFLVGETEDAWFIVAIIIINAILGTWQEAKAENSAAALRSLVKIQARVKRNSQLQPVSAEELVPGDVVFLESGVKVPCDLRLFEVQNLLVEEALLTGESIAILKNEQALPVGESALGERVNMAFAATAVVKGRAWGVVTTTGIATEIGKIADSLATSESEQPPLIQRMNAFSKMVGLVVVGVCLVLGLIGWWRGMEVFEIFFFMVAVGVSAVPEGLPVALTVALSIGTRRMAQRNVIVRKLPAVEGLGSCTLIASDKTGTLTMDQQAVRQVVLPDTTTYEVTGAGYSGEGTLLHQHAELVGNPPTPLAQLVEAAALCNEGTLQLQEDGQWAYSGDAIDVALLALAYKSGRNPSQIKQAVQTLREVPYESELKYSGIFYQRQDQVYFAMKGAAEVIADYLSDPESQQLRTVSDQMAAQGLRVIALASGPVSTPELENLPVLTWLGCLGLLDPLRPEAKIAVQACQQAGVAVAMVTGDHPTTALAIARELGLAQTPADVITGLELAELEKEPQTLASSLAHKRVFARVAPLQKKTIVEAMKANGHFVMVTGDGANDAPALKVAHIGVAMGSGTDLTKEAASIIVTDNNFASIAAGVEEGRNTYDNLRKIIYLLISTGAAELLLVAVPLIIGMPLPFVAVQLLWLNLVTNGIQDVALAFEKGDATVMQRPARQPNEPIFNRLMTLEILISAVVMAALSASLWYWLIEVENIPERHARSEVMLLMVLLQNFHVLNCRSEIKSLFQVPVRGNYFLLIGALVAQLVHVAASYTPFLASVLQLEPIRLREWTQLVPMAAIILVVMEIFKWGWRQRYGTKISV